MLAPRIAALSSQGPNSVRKTLQKASSFATNTIVAKDVLDTQEKLSDQNREAIK